VNPNILFEPVNLDNQTTTKHLSI